MSEQANVRLVQQLYADFGQGKVAQILEKVSADVQWFNPGPPSVPYARRRQGLPGARGFFEDLAAAIDVRSFEPQEFVASGDRVVVFGTWSGVARPTGRDFASDWAMAWTIVDGRVTSFRAYEDTAVLAAAFAT